MPTGVHYDGDYTTAFQVGPVIVTDLPETNSRVYEATYHWLWSEYQKKSNRPNFNSRGPVGTAMEGCPLVGVENVSDLGGGVVEFTRKFAEIPKTRIMPAAYAANVQEVLLGALVELTKSVGATTTITYHFTANPGSIGTAAPAAYVTTADGIYIVGGSNGLVEAERVSVWMGHIYEKESTRFTAPVFRQAV